MLWSGVVMYVIVSRFSYDFPCRISILFLGSIATISSLLFTFIFFHPHNFNFFFQTQILKIKEFQLKYLKFLEFKISQNLKFSYPNTLLRYTKCFESFVSLQEFTESFTRKNKRMIRVGNLCLVSSKLFLYSFHLQVFVVSQRLNSSLYSSSEALSKLGHASKVHTSRITCLVLQQGSHFFHHSRYAIIERVF